jgi:hypothetical protein
MNNAFQKIFDLKKKLQETVQEEGGKLLQEELKKTLDLMPEVEAIAWAQNHSVYNDETYEFESSGFVAIPTKDCPWREAYVKELDCVYDNNDGEAVLDNPHIYPECSYALAAIAKLLPEHAERINFVRDTLRELTKNVPQEVLETFNDIAAKVTRSGITITNCDFGH